MHSRPLTALLAVLFLLMAGCADGPRDLRLGEEECAHCRMFVSEAAFAAQLRTAQGRTHAFDSVECLAEYVERNETEGARLWVTDFEAPGSWLEAERAAYLQSPNLRSPMGLNLSAYASRTDAQAQEQAYEGTVLNWTEVLHLVSDARSMSRTSLGPSHAH